MEPIRIRNKDHLKRLAAFMKQHADRDDIVAEYPTATGVDPTVQAVVGSLDEEERRRLLEYKGGAAIVWNMRMLSLQLTKDDMHGHQWHLSMTEVVGPGMLAVPPDSYVLFVLEAFFSKTEAVPNPGKMKQILHFVGND